MQAGHEVFFADRAIRPGQIWRDAITTALKRCDAALFVVSVAFIGSSAAMAEAEFASAYSEAGGKPLILPIIIDVDHYLHYPPDLITLPILGQFQAILAPDKNLDEIIPRVQAALEAAAGRLLAQSEEKLKVQARIESNAAEYIGRQLSELRVKEKSLKRSAHLWYSAALMALIGGVAFALWRAFASAAVQPTWQSIAQLAVASVIVVGLLGALSRFAFILGKSFMVESLRNGDRIHAISFGEFYLKTFPDKTEWSEIKEAFQHWNIDSGSSFKTQRASDIDPQISKLAIEVAKTIAGLVKGKD
jgi:hypothetical protein